MSDELRDQIYNNLSQQDTETLVNIWRANDRVEWSDTAFDVIRQILLERLGELPPQASPDEMQAEAPEDEGDPEAVFYQPQQVVWLEKWLNRVAKLSLVVIPIANLPFLVGVKDIIWSYSLRNPDALFSSWFLALVVWVLLSLLSTAITYFPLKALASILNILMEMEFASRSKAEG